MNLAYRAYDGSGKEVAGTLESANPQDAVESLRRKGLYAVEITQAQGKAARNSRGLHFKRGGSRKLKNLAFFTRQLSVLVSSGTRLVDALGALERQANEGPWRDTIAELRLRVEEGAPLSEAMEAHAAYFDPIYRSLVAAGESSGNLSMMLDRLAGLKQRHLRIRNVVIGAMIYPCLLLVIAVVVFALLLVFVVPRFAELFESLDVPLPAATRLLVTFSGLFRSYPWLLPTVLIVPVMGLRAWLRTPRGRLFRDSSLLRLPQVGKIARNFATARIVRLLGVLMQGHVTVLEALRLTRNAAGNIHYERLMADAEERVSRGEPISSALAQTDLISPTVYEAVRSGEQSGQVGPLLLNMADFLDEENEVVIRSLASIIEPVILIVMGLLVGLVAVSMFLPLFDLTSMIGGG